MAKLRTHNRRAREAEKQRALDRSHATWLRCVRRMNAGGRSDGVVGSYFARRTQREGLLAGRGRGRLPYE